MVIRRQTVLRGLICILLLFGCDDGENGSPSKTDGGDTETEQAEAPDFAVTETRLYIKNFEMQSSSVVEEDPTSVADAAFEPDSWYPVTVPVTVLRALVQNGVYPDPYIGLNNMLIPDADDDFNNEWGLAELSHLPDGSNPWAEPYYFRAVLDMPKTFEGKEIRLTFNGINYRADVFLNGRKIADHEDVVGMFEQFVFDVTEEALPGEENVLTALIYPLDYPAEPSAPQLTALGSFGANCGVDSEIGKNVAMEAAVGWDWIPAVRDRNMGIWQDVFFSAVAPLDIRAPQVTSSIDFGDPISAALTLSAEVENPTDEAVAGTLWAQITPDNFEGALSIELHQKVTVKAGKSAKVVFSPEDFDALNLTEPALWQPVGFGDPNLYRVRLVMAVDGEAADAETFRFGIREITTDVTDEVEPKRTFFVNGRRVQMRGGAWVPDLLLDRDAKRYRDELLFSREAGFNTVRIWGGGVTPPDVFFDICDELGLLVWLDFWITGDCHGTWGKGSLDWPLEGDVFLSNAKSVIKRVRSHASLCVYTAGNEGYPREEIYTVLRNDLVDGLDGTRPFLPSSGMGAEPPEEWGLSLPDNGPAGVYTGGPYWWVEPRFYFRSARALSDWQFKDEVGLPSLPPLRSLEKFILDTEADPEAPFPLNSTFGYHDASDSDWRPMYSAYDTAIRVRYGEIEDLADYAAKAQILTAENMRALFEAANASYRRMSGLLLWKTNSSWPSVIWQVYDWYLRPNAGYYYAKKADELLHVQLNADTDNVEVINRGDADAEGLTVSAEVLSFDLETLSEQEASADISSDDVQTIFALELPDTWEDVLWVKLVLTDADDEVVSENFYWLSANDDFTALMTLPKTELSVSGTASATDDTVTVAAEVTNPTDGVAFFINVLVLKGEDGEEVLPTYWNDNYFTLLPGETRSLTATFDAADLGDAEPYLRAEGINIVSESVALD